MSARHPTADVSADNDKGVRRRIPADRQQKHLHHSREEDVVLEGVCITLLVVVELVQQVMVAHVLPAVHGLRGNLQSAGTIELAVQM